MAITSTADVPPARLSSLMGSGPVRWLVNAGFNRRSRRRAAAVASLRVARVQERTLRDLVRVGRDTRFGRDHEFRRIDGIAAYRAAVPLRTYEALWNDYLRDRYPVLEDLTWPGRIPYFALTSGTTQGATKYIPVSRAMVASNRRAAETMLAFHVAARGSSRLFRGRMFFLGGTTKLEEPAPGVRQGDLSGIAALEVEPAARAYTYPPLDLALESDWDRKLSRLAERSVRERITLVGGVPSWLLMLFRRVLKIGGKSTIGEIWPDLELVVHGGVKFDPYAESFRRILGRPDIRLQDAYACSEGFVAFGDPATGHLRLALDHGIFYEFVPVEELDSPSPVRHWLGDVQPGVNYAIVVTTCAGLWGHVIGDTLRFESVDPPLITFTGRTRYTLSAFGEHLINEEVEGAIATASLACKTAVGDWHVGPVFRGTPGFHQYVVEFQGAGPDPVEFRRRLDADLSRRNADYLAHRAEKVGLPLPALLVARPGSFESWMRDRGKLGGQNKVPRMDATGKLTADLVEYLHGRDLVDREIAAG
ncbi:GH3 family domain-containing protein [Aquisphaera insulae]|uniref:GH3 family domain-containing protein n=1 Tax=Aquisphaera insulae TaxID=2712864 RepID=UPI0013EE1A20|nr:GH3 auxin-responsive promoter family protein [Aquisphaera insulae]